MRLRRRTVGLALRWRPGDRECLLCSHSGRRVCGRSAGHNIAVSVGSGASAHNTPFRLTSSLQGIHKIKHVVVIMQENRSFESYFGTNAGADGIPAGVA
jgi:phospholipase C